LGPTIFKGFKPHLNIWGTCLRIKSIEMRF
jgi:hypothetical protein